MQVYVNYLKLAKPYHFTYRIVTKENVSVSPPLSVTLVDSQVAYPSYCPFRLRKLFLPIMRTYWYYLGQRRVLPLVYTVLQNMLTYSSPSVYPLKIFYEQLKTCFQIKYIMFIWGMINISHCPRTPIKQSFHSYFQNVVKTALKPLMINKLGFLSKPGKI